MSMTPATSTALELFPAFTDGEKRNLPAENISARNRIRRTISDGSPAEKVHTFRRLYELPLPSEFREWTMAEKVLHIRLLQEEFQELTEATTPVDQIDGLLDLIYVAYGALLNFGLKPSTVDELFAEVHASNLTKVDSAGEPIYDTGGKVQKGPSYVRPSLDIILSGILVSSESS